MRVLVVVNPRATTTTARQRDVVLRALANSADVTLSETANRGHAAALACRAMREGSDAVIAFGGDGTVNEVINGLLTDGIHPGVPALGIVPGGSTNVLARALGLPNDPVDAAAVLLGAMSEQRYRHIGLGQAGDRWFGFAAGVGYDAAVVAAVERQRGRGKRSTHALYLRTAMRTYFQLDRRNPAITLTLPDGDVMTDLHLALITNCTPWTFLGSRAVSPTPTASFDHGLDVYLRTRMGTVGMLASSLLMLRGRRVNSRGDTTQAGRAGRARAAIFGDYIRHDLAEFTLTTDRPMPLQVDGDSMPAIQSVSFRSVANALRVLI